MNTEEERLNEAYANAKTDAEKAKLNNSKREIVDSRDAMYAQIQREETSPYALAKEMDAFNKSLLSMNGDEPSGK